MNREGPDRGAATVLVVGVIAVLLAVAAAVAPLVVVVMARQHAAVAAEAAALAGADTALGVAAGIPCATALRVARVDGVERATCRQDGTDVRVDTTVEVLGFDVVGAARAGAPGDRSGATLRGASFPSVYGVRDPRPRSI